MHIQDFFQNFLKLFLVGLHGDCTISLIAQDMSPFSTAFGVLPGFKPLIRNTQEGLKVVGRDRGCLLQFVPPDL